MEEKTAKDIAKQLTRIADALEKSNAIEDAREKRHIKLERLEEKNLKANLKQKVNVDPSKVIKTSPTNSDYRDTPIAEK
jgi:hypothetical protein